MDALTSRMCPAMAEYRRLDGWRPCGMESSRRSLFTRLVGAVGGGLLVVALLWVFVVPRARADADVVPHHTGLRGGSSASPSEEVPNMALPVVAAAGRPLCQMCESDGTSLECRACTSNISIANFCSACRSQGLNDIGCNRCGDGAPDHRVIYGGDADDHGCYATAGYRWCASNSSCIRLWEQGIQTEREFTKLCAPPEGVALMGGDGDEHGCHSSAGYQWCEAKSECIRLWEHGIRTEHDFVHRCAAPQVQSLGDRKDEHGCIPSAGYRWCEAISSCIRPWEQNLTSTQQFAHKCSF